jgi:hypothetical protein
MEFLEDHFHPMLSAFRPGFGCQTALLKIVEDWKRALDDNKYIAAISMNFLFRERHFFYIKEIPELILDLQEISKNL